MDTTAAQSAASSSTVTLLLIAIGALVSAIVFMYFDGKKERKNHAKQQVERDERFSAVIKDAVTLHQKQEDDTQLRHEKATNDLVESHRKEMAGMVDRVIEASRNDREHDREDRMRILALAESLERRAQSPRGGRG